MKVCQKNETALQEKVLRPTNCLLHAAGRVANLQKMTSLSAKLNLFPIKSFSNLAAGAVFRKAYP
jgi:hypothetical protein